jgi:DNA-binding transcriptional LysR family regulator
MGREAGLHSQAGRARRGRGFLSVPSTGNFRRAATELGVTPPAIGLAVRTLGIPATGPFRLSIPRVVVPILLEPSISSFCLAYPDVEVEIAESEELVDLAAKGFDASIQLGQFIAADMVAVHLTPPIGDGR